jgi:EmrB/QacA subfamily drug resistance transporter
MVFVAATFMDILDTTVVNVALPTLGAQFHAGTGSIEWVVTGYLLSLAVWIPASGWIGDRYGTKKTLLFALAAFTAASALCGQAHSLGELIGFRILQGVGGGMLTPVGIAMLFRAFPPEQRARASSVLLLPTVLAPASGPILGGWLVDTFSWRWIFYVNLPLGVAAFIFGWMFLEEHTEPTAGGFDVAGFVLSGAGLASVLYALSQGPDKGWGSGQVLVSGLGGIVLFVLLVVVELRIDKPMLEFRLLGDRMFRAANTVSLLAVGSFLGLLFLLPLLLQEVRGLSPLESGLTTFPQAIGVMLSSQFVGRLYPRIGPRRMIMFGMTGAAFVIFSFTQIDLGTSLWWIRFLMFIRGVFMAFTFMPLQAATYATIEPSDTGRASSIFSTGRQVGSALGVAVLATALATRTTHRLAGLTGSTAVINNAKVAAFHDAFIVAGIIAVLAALSGLMIHDEDAARTMVLRGKRTEVAAH